MSGTLEERASDLERALLDKEVKAILCSRGGYGAVHLPELIPPQMVAANPKWLIGFSDISVLHALWLSAGVASIHGPMAKHICSSAEPDSGNPDDLPRLIGLLTCCKTEGYALAPDPFNIPGEAHGTLIGGNFSVISALASTSIDPFATPDNILFIEDINEPVYKIERLLYRLRLSPHAANIRGIVAGSFTGVPPDLNHPSMYSMIHHATAGWGIPVAFGFPAGHGGKSAPLIMGAEAALNVTADGAYFINTR